MKQVMEKASIVVCVLILFHILRLGVHGIGLSYNFYEQSCPQVEDIVRNAMRAVFIADPTAPSGLLRLMFHDCQVQVCYVIISIASTFTITCVSVRPLDNAASFDLSHSLVLQLSRATGL